MPDRVVRPDGYIFSQSHSCYNRQQWDIYDDDAEISILDRQSLAEAGNMKENMTDSSRNSGN